MKAEDHFAGSLNDDQMLTIENTDQAQKYETYAARMIDIKTTVPLAGTSNDDTRHPTPLKWWHSKLNLPR